MTGMPPAVLWGVIITGVGVLVTLTSVVLARIGQKGDQEAKFVSDQFTRMLGENTFLTGQLTGERSGRLTDRNEWESRWSRQMERCRAVTDHAAATILRLMGGDVAKQRDEAETTLREIQGHIDSDHPGPHWVDIPPKG